MKMPIATSRNQRGIALIAVLWLSVLLAFISTAANRVSRADVTSALNAQSALAARNAVDSAIDVALFDYMTGPDGTWHANGTPYGWRIGDIEVRVALSDENWRVDLNTASEAALAEMLSSLGVGDTEAETHVRNILAHRDQARANQGFVATEAQLRDAGHYAFGLVEDVQTVTGMSQQLADRVARVASVYTGLDTPGPRPLAPGTGGSDGEDVELTAVPQPLVSLAEAPDTRTDMVRIQAEARTAQGAYFAREMVVELNRDVPGRPYGVRLQRQTDNRLFAAGN